MTDRYSRQIIFPWVGDEGQRRLSRSRVAIVGCGALGGIIATSLVRAGVGKVRIIDRDFIELHNLQRQVLFDEDDIKNGLPKAVAAERHLKKVNSAVEIEGIVADVNYTNVERFVIEADVILDGLDNFETRLLINDVALKHGIPWIYGGAVSSFGMTATIIPHETPCFRCFLAGSTRGRAGQTCDTAGIINSVPFIIGSLQSAEAMKLLVGAEDINRELITIDVWRGTFHRFKISPRRDCPACQDKYEYLEGSYGLRTISLCGQNSVQVLNTEMRKVSLAELAARLKPVAEVSYNDFMLRFTADKHEMVVFPDGRAILRNSADDALAKGLYAKYVGK